MLFPFLVAALQVIVAVVAIYTLLIRIPRALDRIGDELQANRLANKSD